MERLISGAVLALIFAMSGAAFAGNNPCKVGPPAARSAVPGKDLQYSANDTEVVVHRGRPFRSVLRGFHPLDKPAILHCESASGCLLIAHAWTVAETSGALTCTYVDGHPMEGNWTTFGGVPDFSDALISSGDHSVRTKLFAYNPGTIDLYAITYTMYDQRAGARIRTPHPAN